MNISISRVLGVIFHLCVIIVCLMDDVFLDGEVLSEDILDSKNRIKDPSSVAIEAG